MNGGHGAVVTGIHRLQHVQSFGAARFSDDDAVGAHTQRIDHQIAGGDGARAFDIVVVLPEPEPPEMTMLSLASAHPLRNSSMPCDKVWFLRSSSVVSSFFP
jgi:hypothetical protein